jgi:glycine/D-amino acid oxidase-like deaminating enzyme
VNAGHFRKGVVMAPASVRLLLELMRKHSGFADLSPYAIDKYIESTD